MTEAGCQWGQSWDLEVPLYFGGKGFEENAVAETLQRP
jgi:dimethylglycine dehydrogenase